MPLRLSQLPVGPDMALYRRSTAALRAQLAENPHIKHVTSSVAM
jgi:hypothetical protein